jgi:hypothetical protein
MKFRYKKITVKIGSNVLAKPDGTLNVSRLPTWSIRLLFFIKKVWKWWWFRRARWLQEGPYSNR